MITREQIEEIGSMQKPGCFALRQDSPLNMQILTPPFYAAARTFGHFRLLSSHGKRCSKHFRAFSLAVTSRQTPQQALSGIFACCGVSLPLLGVKVTYPVRQIGIVNIQADFPADLGINMVSISAYDLRDFVHP